MSLHPAQDRDLAAIADLVNAAYRGQGKDRGAQQGWTSEADYIDGARTSAAMLREDLDGQPDARLLVWRDAPEGPVLGCVWLEPAADQACYLGLLTVSPDLQARRMGRRLLAAAEAFAADTGARRMRMSVVNVRESLIAWYERRGYVLTSETAPFPYDSQRFGTPRRDDLHFVVLEKGL